MDSPLCVAAAKHTYYFICRSCCSMWCDAGKSWPDPAWSRHVRDPAFAETVRRFSSYSTGFQFDVTSSWRPRAQSTSRCFDKHLSTWLTPAGSCLRRVDMLATHSRCHHTYGAADTKQECWRRRPALVEQPATFLQHASSYQQFKRQLRTSSSSGGEVVLRRTRPQMDP